MDNTEKIYNYIKTSMDKNGFIPTVKQLAEEFDILENEAKSAIEKLEESGRIKITDILGKTTIKFCD